MLVIMKKDGGKLRWKDFCEKLLTPVFSKFVYLIVIYSLYYGGSGAVEVGAMYTWINSFPT